MPRIALLPLLFASSIASAVQTDSHIFEGYQTFSDGELNGVAVHWDGGVGVGPTLGQGIRPPAGTVIWDLTQIGDEFLYLATGGPGAVYRMEVATGAMEKILDPDEPLLRAIHVDKDGNLFGGASPGGRIYRVSNGNGFPEIYADLESLYIWKIVEDPENKGALLIAAGSPGRIYRLPANYSQGDEPEVVLETRAVHVSSFAFANDGTLYYATGPGGHLLRKSPDEKAETMLELGQGEVRAIFPMEDGSVRIAVYRSGKPSMSSDNGNGNGNEEASLPPDGLPSGIFNVGPDGFVDVLLLGSDEKVFSAAMIGEEMLIGSDARGRVYRFQDRFDWSLLAESNNGGEVSRIEAIDEQEAWIATSNPAAIHRLTYDLAATGTLTGKVFDAGQKVRWGALMPVGIQLDSIHWETRTGNRSDPDESWGEWTPLKDQKVASSPGRFFQYRARFASPATVVRRVELFYQLPNEAPIFRRVEGIPVRLESVPAPPQAPQRAALPQLFSQNGNRKSSQNDSPPPFIIHEDRGWLSLIWEAIDPNQDELRFKLYLRRLDQQDWLLLAEDLKEPFFSLNINGFPSGYYEPRIEASDRMSNPPGLAKTAETRGNLILIDNEPPTIIPPKDDSPLEFQVNDAFSIITAVSYRFEGSESRALLPLDGIFDSRETTFRLPESVGTDSTPPQGTLHIEATDARGNRAAWTGLIGGTGAD